MFNVIAKATAKVAETFTTTCVGLFHEPKMPQELKKSLK
jgi:cyclic lactone autoinducer peptide